MDDEHVNDDVAMPTHRELTDKLPLWLKCLIVGVFIFTSVMLGKRVEAATTIVAPTGNVLAGTTVTFDWTTNNNNVRGYHVFIGEYSGTTDYYNSQVTGEVNPPITVSGLPDDGGPVEMRIYEVRNSGNWTQESNFSFTAATGSDDGGGDGEGDGDGGDNGDDGGTGDNGGTLTLDAATQEAIADMTATSTYMLETLVILGACGSFFTGWKVGMTR